MKVIYIAGPFRGKDHYEIKRNVDRAEELALQVWRSGHAAICPHLNTQNFQDAAPDEVWLKGDIEIMLRCDAVLTTPDWERSSGARKEIEIANQKAIPVFHTLAELVAYYDNES